MCGEKKGFPHESSHRSPAIGGGVKIFFVERAIGAALTLLSVHRVCQRVPERDVGRRTKAMRVVQNVQMEIGEVDVSKVKFDLKSRDDIPKILRGLQHLYVDPALRTQLFELLQAEVLPKTDKRNGRPGMTLWRIFVCGVVRLDLNIDYDRLHELVNQHNTLREMLGHGVRDKEPYHYQTLKDNVGLLTVELLDKINQLVVNAGHVVVKKKENEALRGRCDSFVVETDVHYPTDINLLYDAMRKVITLTAGVRAAGGERLAATPIQCAASQAADAQSSKQQTPKIPIGTAAKEKRGALYRGASGVFGGRRALPEQSPSHRFPARAKWTAQRIGCCAQLEIEGFMRTRSGKSTKSSAVSFWEK